MAPGSVSRPAEDTTLLSTVDTTRTSSCLLASRCAAPPAEEPFATVCETTASTVTTDEEEKATDVERCLDEDNCVIFVTAQLNLNRSWCETLKWVGSHPPHHHPTTTPPGTFKALPGNLGS